MFDTIITLLVAVAAISAGLMAGVYFAFSGFIMRSFDQLGALPATDAMNAINEVILRSWFMVLFFGSTLLYAVIFVLALVDADVPGQWNLLLAGAIYVLGMFACTVLFNVPLNNRLAKAVGDAQIRSGLWMHYRKTWTRWNHFRTVCSLAVLVLGMQYLAQYA
jgi:uncharacterized membrane protein